MLRLLFEIYVQDSISHVRTYCNTYDVENLIQHTSNLPVSDLLGYLENGLELNPPFRNRLLENDEYQRLVEQVRILHDNPTDVSKRIRCRIDFEMD